MLNVLEGGRARFSGETLPYVTLHAFVLPLACNVEKVSNQSSS